MKSNIKWHESCLIARRNTLERARLQIEQMKAAFERSLADAEFLALQIATAKKQGKTDFDDARFLVKKK